MVLWCNRFASIGQDDRKYCVFEWRDLHTAWQLCSAFPSNHTMLLAVWMTWFHVCLKALASWTGRCNAAYLGILVSGTVLVQCARCCPISRRLAGILCFLSPFMILLNQICVGHTRIEILATKQLFAMLPACGLIHRMCYPRVFHRDCPEVCCHCPPFGQYT